MVQWTHTQTPSRSDDDGWMKSKSLWSPVWETHEKKTSQNNRMKNEMKKSEGFLPFSSVSPSPLILRHRHRISLCSVFALFFSTRDSRAVSTTFSVCRLFSASELTNEEAQLIHFQQGRNEKREENSSKESSSSSSTQPRLKTIKQKRTWIYKKAITFWTLGGQIFSRALAPVSKWGNTGKARRNFVSFFDRRSLEKVYIRGRRRVTKKKAKKRQESSSTAAPLQLPTLLTYIRVYGSEVHDIALRESLGKAPYIESSNVEKNNTKRKWMDGSFCPGCGRVEWMENWTTTKTTHEAKRNKIWVKSWALTMVCFFILKKMYTCLCCCSRLLSFSI